jgi:hypothetical protein
VYKFCTIKNFKLCVVDFQNNLFRHKSIIIHKNTLRKIGTIWWLLMYVHGATMWFSCLDTLDYLHFVKKGGKPIMVLIVKIR